MYDILKAVQNFLIVNTPIELFAIAMGMFALLIRDRWKYRHVLQRLSRHDATNRIMVEQVIVREPKDKRRRRRNGSKDGAHLRARVFFRHLRGHTTTEKLFDDPAVVEYAHQAAKNGNLLSPVLTLADAGWSDARDILCDHVSSANAYLGKSKPDWYVVIPTCWKRGEQRSAIRIFVIKLEHLRKFLDDEWWPRLLVENATHDGRIAVLRQVARVYFGVADNEQQGSKQDMKLVELQLDDNFRPQRFHQIDWQTTERREWLQLIGVERDMSDRAWKPTRAGVMAA